MQRCPTVLTENLTPALGGGQGKFRRRADEAPDMPAILRSLLEVASGMAYLHSLGVLHGARSLLPVHALFSGDTD